MIIVQEIIHSMANRKGNMGFMAIKVDLEKVYNRLSWNFLADTLKDFGISDYMVNIIMRCVSMCQMRIILNEKLIERIYIFRGIRQGDPLSLSLPISLFYVLRDLLTLLNMQLILSIGNPLN